MLLLLSLPELLLSLPELLLSMWHYDPDHLRRLAIVPESLLAHQSTPTRGVDPVGQKEQGQDKVLSPKPGDVCGRFWPSKMGDK